MIGPLVWLQLFLVKIHYNGRIHCPVPLPCLYLPPWLLDELLCYFCICLQNVLSYCTCYIQILCIIVTFMLNYQARNLVTTTETVYLHFLSTCWVFLRAFKEWNEYFSILLTLHLPFISAPLHAADSIFMPSVCSILRSNYFLRGSSQTSLTWRRIALWCLITAIFSLQSLHCGI